MALVDVAGDGRKEVVTGSPSNAELHARGMSSGGLAESPRPVSTGVTAARIVAAARRDPGLYEAVLVSDGGKVVNVVRADTLGGTGFLPAEALGPTTHPVVALASGDLDGDGLPDVVATTSPGLADAVMVFSPGSAANGWAPVDVVVPGPPATLVVVGDADDDGRPEALFVPAGTAEVWALRVTPTPSAVKLFTASAAINGLRLADMDADGKREMVLATGDVLFSVQVVKAVRSPPCDPVFQGAMRFARMGYTPRHIATLDVDGDGTPDLASASDTVGMVNLARGRGNGEVSPAGQITVTEGVGCLHAGDVDQDGRTDLTTCNVFSAGVTVHLNKADGWHPVAGTLPEAQSQLLAAALADMDGDLDLDVVYVVNSIATGDNVAGLFLFDAGALTPTTTYVTSPAGSHGLATGDFDSDGDIDVAVSTGGRVTVVRNQGDGSREGQYVVEVVGADDVLLAGDFNGDGRTDAVSTDGSEFSYLLTQDDVGQLVPVELWPPLSGPFLKVVDANHDNAADIVMREWAGAGWYGIRLLKGGAIGGFESVLSSETFGSHSALEVSDLDGDGNLDLVLGDEGDWSLSVYPAVGPDLVMERGAVDLAAVHVASLTADFNGDGRADVAVLDGTGTVVTKVAGADGALVDFPNQASNAVDMPHGLVAADLDNDGQDDLVVLEAGGLSVHHAQRGGFGAGMPVDQPGYFVAAAVGELTGDGWPDIVVVGDGVVYLFTRTFVSYQAATLTSANVFLVDVMDVNHDGLLDVLVGGDDVSVLANGEGGVHGAFSSPTDLGVGPVQAMRVVDLDGDGLLDLVYLDSAMGDLTWVAGRPGWLGGTRTAMGMSASGFALGDLDGDAKVDLVTLEAGTYFSTWRGDGAGGFTRWKQHDLPGVARRVDVVRIDGDARADIQVFSASATTQVLRVTQR